MDPVAATLKVPDPALYDADDMRQKLGARIVMRLGMIGAAPDGAIEFDMSAAPEQRELSGLTFWVATGRYPPANTPGTVRVSYP